jgi:integrase/recombinase XerD
MVSRSSEAAMTNTTLPPFQPDTMTPAQLAAVCYLARYTGATHRLYA